MNFSWKRWLRSLDGCKLPVSIRHSKRIQRVLFGAEWLEDRVVPAVDISDITNRWLPELSNQVSSILGNASQLDTVLPGLGKTLDAAYDTVTQLNQTIALAQGVGGASVAAYLTNLDTFAQFDISNFDTSNPDRISFTITIRPPADPEAISLVIGGSDFGNLALDLGNGVTLQLANNVTITTIAVIDEANFANNNPAGLRFVPAATSIMYSPSLTTGQIPVIEGTLGGAIDYAGSVTGSLASNFRFVTSGGTTAPLSSLSTSASYDSANSNPGQLVLGLDATLEPDLQPFRLPAFSYHQDFKFDVLDGASHSDPARITLNGHDIREPDGQHAVIHEILGGAAGQVFSTLKNVIPEDVANVLLGEVNLFAGYQLSDLLQSLSSVAGDSADTPLDALQVFGVPGPVIEVIESIVQAADFAHELENPTADTEAKARRIGLMYIGMDGPQALFNSVVQIFQGQTIDLVRYEIDLVDKLENDPLVNTDPRYLAAKAAGILTIEQDVPNVSGGHTDYLKVQFGIDSEQIKNNLLDGLSGGMRDAAELLLGWAFAQGEGFSLSGSFGLSAAVAMGVDTSFLQGGTLADSIWISSGNLLDVAFSGDANVRFSVPVPGGNIIQGAIDGASQGWEDAGLPTKPEDLDPSQWSLTGGLSLPTIGDLREKAGSIDATAHFGGSFLFGICDPTPDGKLRFSELPSNPLDIAALKTTLEFGAKGSGYIAGIPYSFSFGPYRPLNLAVGCEPAPGSDGPNLEDLKNGTGIPPVMIEKVFAELVGDVLQVSGSSSSDVIDIQATLGGFVYVTRNGRQSAFFDPFTFSSIVVDLDGAHITVSDPILVFVPEDGGDDILRVHPSVPVSKPVTAWGGSGNDRLSGTNFLGYFGGSVTFHGGGGSDILIGAGGRFADGFTTYLFGEASGDQLISGPGAVAMFGGEGSDILQGLDQSSGFTNYQNDPGLMVGGPGVDMLIVGTISRGNFALIGGDLVQVGQEGLLGDPGNNILIGGFGDDTLVAGNATTDAGVIFAETTRNRYGVTFGGPGDDRIFGNGGDDILIGGTMNSTVSAGFDVIDGASGNDHLASGNTLLVGANSDLVADQKVGGYGSLDGGVGTDVLLGGPGNDYIDGGAGEDTIDAGLGQNAAYGGSEADTFILGRGIDTIFGEGGGDLFLLTNPAGTIHSPGGFITIDGGGQSGDILVMSGGGGITFIETYVVDGTGSGGLIVTTNGTLFQGIKFAKLAAIQDTVTTASLAVTGPDSGDRIEIRDGGQLNGNATEVRSDHFTPIRLKNKTSLIVDGGGGADDILVNNPVPAVGLQALTVRGGDGGDTIAVITTVSNLDTAVFGDVGADRIIIGNAGRSLADIRGHLAASGGQGDDDLLLDDTGTPAAQTYALSSTRMRRSGISDIDYDSTETIRLNGGAGANAYTVTSTGATTSTLIDDGAGVSQFNVQGDGLVGANLFRGNGGAEAFTLNVGTGVTGTAISFDGGDGADNLAVNARAGDDQVALRVNSAVGNGTMAGLGQVVGFLTMEAINLDGKGGTNSLAWVDDTNAIYGTALAPENGIIVRPTSAVSGDVRLGLAGTLFPFVAFTNVNGNFSVSGDGDGSGDQDVVSVLAASTAGLQSSWGELGTADGVDTITVSDRLVEIENKVARVLRSVALVDAGGLSTFSTLYVRGGAEPRPFGDNVFATPSKRLNILLDGMDPTSGRPGDNLKVNWVGSRSLVKSRDNDLGPEHARFVQDNDGASIGIIHFEKVYDTQISVNGTGAGIEGQVIIYDPTTGKARFGPFVPFPGFTGGLSVASGDVTGDGIADVIVGAGNGGGPAVVIYDGIEGTELTRYFAYEDTFRGGVHVSAGDVDGDGFAEVVSGTGVGGGPRVIAWSLKDQKALQDYFAYESSLRSGVQISVGDTNGDGFVDIFTGAGEGGGPRVRLFDGKDLAVLADFFTFDQNQRGGVFVALGDLDGDFISDMIAGNGKSAEPVIHAYHGRDAGLLADFYANDPFAPGAIPEIPLESATRVGATDMDGDGVADILVGKGPGTRPILRGYKVISRNQNNIAVIPTIAEIHRQTLFNEEVFGWGVYVGGSD